jgi:hypothetical protein
MTFAFSISSFALLNAAVLLGTNVTVTPFICGRGT